LIYKTSSVEILSNSRRVFPQSDPKLPVLDEEADVRELWHPAGNPQSQFTVAVILYGDQITVAN